MLTRVNNFIKQLDALTDKINNCNCVIDVSSEWVISVHQNEWSVCFNGHELFIQKDESVFWTVLLMSMFAAFSGCNRDAAWLILPKSLYTSLSLL